MFKREFRINLKSLLLWSIILSIVYILIFVLYPSMINKESIDNLKIVMQSMPKDLLSSFNMDIIGIEDAYGWFKTEGYTFLTLVGGLYAAILGSTLLIKEENDKTIEFLCSKPINRNKIVTSKILCGIINLFIFICIVTIFNYIGLYSNNNFEIKEFLMISLIPLLLYYLLFFVSLYLSTFFKKTKKSMSIGIVIVFVSYLMQIIGNIGDKLKILKDISFFEFASSRYILLNNALNLKYIVIGIVIIVICIILIYRKYNKKEFV